MALQNRKINPWKWQDAFGFSQGIETTGQSRVLRVSGQTSVNADAEPQHEGDPGCCKLATQRDNPKRVRLPVTPLETLDQRAIRNATLDKGEKKPDPEDGRDPGFERLSCLSIVHVVSS